MRPVYEYKLGAATPIDDPLPLPTWTLGRRLKACGWRSRPSAGWESGQVTLEMYERDWAGKNPTHPWTHRYDFMLVVGFKKGFGGYRLYMTGLVNALAALNDLARLVVGTEGEDTETTALVIEPGDVYFDTPVAQRRGR